MSDSLKQAVKGLEAAWRRLREVLDGPSVVAALMERQAVRPMSTAPRDGTWVYLRLRSGYIPTCKWDAAVNHWTDDHRRGHAEQEAIGWSPVK